MHSGGLGRERARERERQREGDAEFDKAETGRERERERGGKKEETDLLLWDSATAYCPGAIGGGGSQNGPWPKK